MACYSFANCAMAGAQYVTPITDVPIPFVNMRTEGILTLLSGQELALHPEDKATLFSSGAWQDFVRETLGADTYENFERFGTFTPLTVRQQDTFLWTPFVDCNCSLSQARCTNGQPYPYVPHPMKDVFPSATRTNLATVEHNWQQMINALSHVQHKGVVLYPTDNTQPTQAELARRNNNYNARAKEIFSAQGWHIFTINPEPKPNDSYWGHFSSRALSALHQEIADTFALLCVPST